MKIYVITDLEGPAMVFSFDQTRLPEATERIAQAKRFLTREVNACVDGILDVDAAAEVVVLDGHGSGGIDYELFHEQAQLIAGYRRPSFACLDETYDALFFVGQHAMAGTPAAPLAHTQSSRTIEYYRLNGELIGEFAQHAILAGTLFGVPTAFLSGDDKAVAEAQTLAPALVGVVTKVGLGLEAARSVSPRRAQKLIRAGAAEACRTGARQGHSTAARGPSLRVRDSRIAWPGGSLGRLSAAGLRARGRANRAARVGLTRELC